MSSSSSNKLSRRSSSVSRSSSSSSSSASSDDVESVCCVCECKIHWLERTEFMGDIYHSQCFKCSSCHKILRPGQFLDHALNPFCHPCYHKQFEIKNVGLLSQSQLKRNKILIDTTDPLQDMKQITSPQKQGKLNIDLFCEKHNIPIQNKAKYELKLKQNIKHRIEKYNSAIQETQQSDNRKNMEIELITTHDDISDDTNISMFNSDIQILDKLKLNLEFYVEERCNQLSKVINEQIFEMEKDIIDRIHDVFQIIKSNQ